MPAGLALGTHNAEGAQTYPVPLVSEQLGPGEHDEFLPVEIQVSPA